MGDVARFTIAPALRCCERLEDSELLVCGELAVSMRAGDSSLPVGYFCARHARASDQPIPAAYLFRRVSVTLEVMLAGASMNQTIAQAEAVARLERAVQGVRGLVNLHTVVSPMGRYAPPPPPLRGLPGRGRVL